MLRVTALYLLTLTVSCGQRADRPATDSNKTNIHKEDSLQPDVRFEVDTTRFNVNKGDLTGKTITINVSYAAIGCTCPQWSETKQMNDTLNGRQYFYLEQGSESIANADTLFDGTHLPQFTLTGQFYDKEGYPKNYKPTKGDPKPARVFKYNKIKIIAAR